MKVDISYNRIRRCDSSLRCAFTLIELLTVIAIIGILAAILIPTVGKVRASGQSAKCISNLRQIGQQLTLFANDNKGNLPAPNLNTITQITDPRIKQQTGSARQLSFLLWPYYTSRPANQNPTPSNHNRHEMFVCPSVDAQYNVAAVPFTNNALSYIINDVQRIETADGKQIYVFGYPGSATIKSLNLSSVEKLVFGSGVATRAASLSTIWALQDGDRSLYTGGGSTPTGARASQTSLLAGEPAHSASRNRLYLDGSVKKLTLLASDS